MKIAILGAGAVGCYYGAMLARAGHEVVLIGRPALVEAVRRDGLRIDMNGRTDYVPMAADTSPEAVRGAGLVLCCVKSPDTAQAGEDMAPFLDPDAVVLSLQNGVDNAERLAAVIKREVVPVVVYVATDMGGPGHVRHHGRGELVLGPGAAGERAAAVLTEAGIQADVSSNAAGALWAKMIVNCAYNGLSALSRRPYGELVAQQGVEQIMSDLIDECLAVAQASGVAVVADVRAAAAQIARTMPGQFSSTAQDMMRGKPTEIDYLNGYIVRQGAVVDVPTPVNRVIHALVKMAERQPA